MTLDEFTERRQEKILLPLIVLLEGFDNRRQENRLRTRGSVAARPNAYAAACFISSDEESIDPRYIASNLFATPSMELKVNKSTEVARDTK